MHTYIQVKTIIRIKSNKRTEYQFEINLEKKKLNYYDYYYFLYEMIMRVTKMCESDFFF